MRNCDHRAVPLFNTAEKTTLQDANPTLDVDSRLTFAVKHDKKFSRLWNMAKSGRETSDNSNWETALAEKVYYWLSLDENATRRVLDRLDLPKWGSRDESYRESIMNTARNYAGDGFNPDESSSGTGGVCRDTAIRVVAIGVVDGLSHPPKGQFRTADVTNADEVDVSDRHARKVLNALEEAGFLQYEKDGRQKYWVAHRNEDGYWNLPAFGHGFFEQFRAKSTVNQQRAEYLGQ